MKDISQRRNRHGSLDVTEIESINQIDIEEVYLENSFGKLNKGHIRHEERRVNLQLLLFPPPRWRRNTYLRNDPYAAVLVTRLEHDLFLVRLCLCLFF